MPLQLTLKPRERVILGGAVVRNGDHRTHLIIENKIPVLREADILSPDRVHTACERLYLTLQLMYVDSANTVQYRKTFRVLADDILDAAPSCGPHLLEIVDHVEAGRLYQALKRTRVLIDHEKELTDRAS